MKVWLHPYQLPRLGALIKVEWDRHRIGYSDLHPFPEFGEPPLEAHIEALASLEFTELVERSLDLNHADAEYRRMNRSAFLGLALPRAHRLVTDIRAINSDDLEEWRALGFTHIKVKMGRRLGVETPKLEDLCAQSNFMWRLDFNACLVADQFTDWWRGLAKHVKTRLDFIEDPAMDDLEGLSGPWADDWVEQDGAEVVICKPARDAPEQEDINKRIIFTHSLDHPLGQAAALWTAARFYRYYPDRAEVCGLGMGTAMLKPPTGIGFGYGEMLAELPWERVR